MWDEFQANRAERGFSRDLITAEAAPLAIKIMEQGLGSLRGAIGPPDQVGDLCRRYEAAGVDQIIFVMQAGPNKHEHICESIELFAERVMPEFAERAEAKEREKLERLAPAIEAALARRQPPREVPPGYTIDEPAEVERAARARRPHQTLRQRALELAREARRSLEKQGQEAVARLVRGASDEQLERRFGNPLAQRAIFAGMVRQFDPRFAFGFEGDILYELDHAGNGKPTARWTIRIEDSRATALPGRNGDPAVRLKLSIPDFARLIAEEVDPQELFFSGRFHVEGDFQVISRLPEMFGQPPRF